MANKIFIVEDEVDLMELYIDVLEINGYEIVGSAANGEEAVEKYTKLEIRPDVIIMDHRMPVKSGIEATREILQLDPLAKVIFASADKSVEDEALSLGIVAFKTKPFSLEHLLKNINACLVS